MWHLKKTTPNLNISLQEESYLEAVDKHTVGKGILFPLQLPVWMPGAL